MAQLSRPFQIALVAVVLLAGVWLFALQGHSTSTGGSGSTVPATAKAPSSSAPSSAAAAPSAAASSPTSAAAEAQAAAAPSHVYTGPVPGLQGLTRDINRAHAAVATSQRQAQQLETKSQQASDEPSPSQAPAANAAAGAPAAGAAARSPIGKSSIGKNAASAVTRTSATRTASTLHGSAATSTSAGASAPSGQRAVEAELGRGDVVLLLFWNPKGADDVAVRRAVQAERGGGHRKIAVHEAAASQVAQYGSVTRGVQVYATPTLFVINGHGQAIVLTGLQDSFTIAQAIEEARQS